jgi:hypothetical protein
MPYLRPRCGRAPRSSPYEPLVHPFRTLRNVVRGTQGGAPKGPLPTHIEGVWGAPLPTRIEGVWGAPKGPLSNPY